MPYNLPTVTTNNISFGPGRVYIGPSGATPSIDIGAIAEDAPVKMTVTAEKRKIVQGNPKVTVLTFTQAQAVMLDVSSLEYNQNTWTAALGSGNTTYSASVQTWAFGGDPFVDQLAIRVAHQMAQPGHTLYANLWKAQSAGGIEFSFGHDEHAFPMQFEAIQASTNWAGSTLPQTEQLVQVVRETA